MKSLDTASLALHVALLLSTIAGFVPRTERILAHVRISIGIDNSGSDLFPAVGSSYVPSGMTPEEYATIKNEEKKKMSKMKFGAFGPRFLMTDRPHGDWMITPRLWTNGFQSDSGKLLGSRTNECPESQTQPLTLKQIYDTIRKYAPYFVLSYTLMDMLGTCVTVLGSTVLAKARRVPVTTLKRIIWRQRHNFDLQKSMLGIHFVKFASAGFLSFPLKRWMETLNRRLLWSPKRIVATLILSACAVLSAWGVLLPSVG